MEDGRRTTEDEPRLSSLVCRPSSAVYPKIDFFGAPFYDDGIV